MENYQRVWAEIDLDAAAHNVAMIRKAIPEKSRFMAVVKADGYGHGAVEMAKVALYNGADSLGLAIVDEGIAIRENNIFAPALILGYTPAPRLFEVVKHNLMQTVFHKEMAADLAAAAKSLNTVAEIHIKIDTGLSRLGFLPDDRSIDEILAISQMDNIRIAGIYTHFAQSDAVSRDFTNEQYNRFTGIIEKLKANGLSGFISHAANSGAVCQYNMFMDMARVGILLYGLSPSPVVDTTPLRLKPVMAFKTQVSYVKEVAGGVSVSYGRTYFTTGKTVVATVPVGYADGVMCALSNRGRVIVGGEYAPIIGRVCMDQMMVDVTAVKGVSPGDEVVLMGSQGNKEITAAEIAQLDGTIVNEVVCGVGKRVPRTYMKNGAVLKTVNL